MMMRSIVIHNIQANHVAAMERWYFEKHGAEIVRRYGPWLTRHESFVPVVPPAEAQSYGVFNWRVTDGWWRELPQGGPKGTFTFTLPPYTMKVAYCFIPSQPTEDFMGSQLQPHEKNVVRWFQLFKYPAGVSREEGEDWYLNTHAKEVMKQPGLFRFFSYKTFKEAIMLPGTWPPSQLKNVSIGAINWDRISEMWYENFDDWKKSVIEGAPQYTKPVWAKYDKYPFLEPGNDFISSFILERPNDEFLRDARLYH